LFAKSWPAIPARLYVASQLATPPGAPTQPPLGDQPPQTPAAASTKPRLFVLVAGVNDYADPRIRLSYAVSDAKDVARAFREASGNLYRSAEISS
jgi:hypothetical protein